MFAVQRGLRSGHDDWSVIRLDLDADKKYHRSRDLVATKANVGLNTGGDFRCSPQVKPARCCYSGPDCKQLCVESHPEVQCRDESATVSILEVGGSPNGYC